MSVFNNNPCFFLGVLTYNLVSYSRESYTIEIAQLVRAKYEELTGKQPHMIVSNLHRAKMDASKEIEEATFMMERAVWAYNSYNEFIQEALDAVQNTEVTTGLFLDLHGHTHLEEWVELGYLLSKTQLNEQTSIAKNSSIRSLVENKCGSDQACFASILYGNESLGSFLQNDGFTTIPSPDHPSPGNGNYFSGGINSREYGSRNGSSIDAVQLGVPRHLRFNATDMTAFADSLAQSLVGFMDLHY